MTTRAAQFRHRAQAHDDKNKGDDKHSGSACYVRSLSYVPNASYQTNEEIPIVCFLIYMCLSDVGLSCYRQNRRVDGARLTYPAYCRR